MPYITFLQLAERPGADELAQLAGPKHLVRIDGALMDATLRGADRSGWAADEILAADAAAEAITGAMAEAAALIDGHLVQGGYSLPLALPPGGSGMTVVTGWARSITRYLLNKDRQTDEGKDPVARDYRDALRLLGQVAQGKFSLGAADPVQAEQTSTTDVRFSGDASVFGRDQLRSFR